MDWTVISLTILTLVSALLLVYCIMLSTRLSKLDEREKEDVVLLYALYASSDLAVQCSKLTKKATKKSTKKTTKKKGDK